MNIHIDWYRWISASINKHFDGFKATYELYIEGDERDTDDLANFAELRTDGPFITQPCKGVKYLDMEINLLIQSVMDPEDLYAGVRTVGQFATGFTQVIKVFKLGDGVQDDGSLLGCLRTRAKRYEDTIDIGNFGIVHQDVKLTQYTIEGHYRLELQE